LRAQKEYDPTTGMETLVVHPISRVAAAQRAGRAGRTCAGRCYRLYTSHALAHDMPAETVPEIGRVSLVGAVLHLKSLAVPGLDVLSFDFLDPPAPGALGDALRQLHVLDAIDADGAITPHGRAMAALPLDPPLACATLAARDGGCLPDMCTLAGLLSAERIFAAHAPGAPPGQPPGAELVSRAEAALGDHIVLLRVFQAWERAGAKRDWCRQHRVQSRGLEFARDVRRQLMGVLKARDVAAADGVGGGSLAALRRALCLGFANRLARRMPRHNGYRTLGDASVLTQLHPSCTPALADADGEGLGPEWVVYHELVATPRPFLRHVCAVEAAWVAPLLTRLQGVDVQRLSGGRAAPAAAAAPALALAAPTAAPGAPHVSVKPKPGDAAVDAARARFLERKRKAGALH
jgi:ATP-dependent RNA helicase DHX8/PRP22